MVVCCRATHLVWQQAGKWWCTRWHLSKLLSRGSFRIIFKLEIAKPVQKYCCIPDFRMSGDVDWACAGSHWLVLCNYPRDNFLCRNQLRTYRSFVQTNELKQLGLYNDTYWWEKDSWRWELRVAQVPTRKKRRREVWKREAKKKKSMWFTPQTYTTAFDNVSWSPADVIPYLYPLTLIYESCSRPFFFIMPFKQNLFLPSFLSFDFHDFRAMSLLTTQQQSLS